MNRCKVEIASLLARTIEKMIRSEGHCAVRLSDDCIRVLAETIDAIGTGRVRIGAEAALAEHGCRPED
jgi:hypothetical protein